MVSARDAYLKPQSKEQASIVMEEEAAIVINRDNLAKLTLRHPGREKLCNAFGGLNCQCNIGFG